MPLFVIIDCEGNNLYDEGRKAYLDTQTMEQLSKWCGISVTDIEKLTDIFCSTAKIPLLHIRVWNISSVQFKITVQSLYCGQLPGSWMRRVQSI